MATTPTPTPPEAPQPANVNDVGVFVSLIPVGYREPAHDEVRRIQDYARQLTQGTDVSLLRNLLMIKLLAPQESADLIIYSVPMAAEFIGRLRTTLAMRYYTMGEK